VKLIEYINEGYINLFSAKLRSLLALLGIIVGTASVVAMISGGKLAEHEALQQFKILGTDLLAISITNDQADEQKNEFPSSLTVSQIMNLPMADENIFVVAPYAQLFHPINFDGLNLTGTILGVTQEFFDVAHVNVARGRFISNLDSYNSYCFIGKNIYQEIIKNFFLNPIGQQIKIVKSFFTIIGVAADWPESSFIYTNINDSIIISAKATLFFEKNVPINNIIMRINSAANIDQIKSSAEQYLQAYSPHDQFIFRSAKELIAQMTKQTKIFTIFLGLIGGISLCVGGIGVMNIMLVSIAERKREIGIRRAVGAKRTDILYLFLVEALMISFLGGLLGVIIGTFISWCFAFFWHWSFAFFWLPSLVGFSISAATGVFFGIYPAHKASCLDPIDALRFT